MTVASFDPNASLVTFTEGAAQHFQAAINQSNEKLVRLSTKTSGCTGYAYVVELVENHEETDTVVAINETLSVAIAADTVGLIRGTEIDMVQEGINHVIKYNNPNVVSECGCGESFSVAE